MRQKKLEELREKISKFPADIKLKGIDELYEGEVSKK